MSLVDFEEESDISVFGKWSEAGVKGGLEDRDGDRKAGEKVTV